MIASSNIDGWIIAGGASRRMGVDKAALIIGGRTMIEIAALALSNICEDRISIAGQPRESAPEWPAFPDDVANTGPLAGLLTALTNGTSEWIAVLSCDMPFVTGEVFERLASLDKPGTDAFVPIQADGRPQSLCALYRRKAVYSVVKDLIAGSERSMQNLLSRLNAQYIPFSALRDLTNTDALFLNINSPDDYDRAISLLAAADS